MRPKRLELQGFASFREKTVVDFKEAQLFVLSGPTGAGKSSVVDAITFALYGNVPRYEDKRLVAPVITQGQLEARVRLDFWVQDELYTAVRVVRRTAGGATTREARLEQGERVLAGNESELSEQVERILGLSFEHFTKCVVLPQGEFAQFLKDKPSERQALLVKLLDIGIYGRMAKRARDHQQNLEEQVSLNTRRLEQDFGHASSEQLKLARRQLRDMEVLEKQIQEAQPKLGQLSQSLKQVQEDIAALDGSIQKLQELAVPTGVSELSRKLTQLAAEKARLLGQKNELSKQRESIEKARVKLPDRVSIADWMRTRKECDQLAARSRDQEKSLRRLEQVERERKQLLEQAERAQSQARTLLEQLQDAHAAAHLAGKLKAGEPCPVCAQPVARLPQQAPPQDLTLAQSDYEAASREAEKVRQDYHRAREELKIQSARLEETQSELAALQRKLKDAPSPKQLADWLKLWEQLEAESARLRETESQLSTDESRIAQEQTYLETKRSAAQKQFYQSRDALAELHPPPLEGTFDLAEAWKALVRWGQDQIPVLNSRRDKLRRRAEQWETQIQEIEDKLQLACEQSGLVPDGRAWSALVTEAVISARSDLKNIKEGIAKAKQLRKELKEIKSQVRLAKEIAALLGTRGFERWYLNRAMRQLVAGASVILNELSSGQYSLTIDEKGSDFLVVDHNSAGEKRLARTLSGGETFMASLSLALALSEHVVGHSAKGSARLEAIFLDEGFGTLDPDTLETVATALDELGQRGRMVGLITHVPELAGRIPVRYQISKDAGGSHVERISQ